MDSEGIVTSFYETISDPSSSARDMTNFYCALFETHFTVDLQKAIGRAIKLYGKEVVFYAILSLDGMENINHTNIYPLLRFVCNKRLTDSKKTVYNDLASYADNMQKLSEKSVNTKWKVRDPFND